jgi:hypothetical protein
VAEFVSAILYHFNREGRDSFTPQILNPKHQTSNNIKALNTNSQKRLGFLNFGICICLELVFWDLEFIQWGLPRSARNNILIRWANTILLLLMGD